MVGDLGEGVMGSKSPWIKSVLVTETVIHKMTPKGNTRETTEEELRFVTRF